MQENNLVSKTLYPAFKSLFFFGARSVFEDTLFGSKSDFHGQYLFLSSKALCKIERLYAQKNHENIKIDKLPES